MSRETIGLKVRACWVTQSKRQRMKRKKQTRPFKKTLTEPRVIWSSPQNAWSCYIPGEALQTFPWDSIDLLTRFQTLACDKANCSYYRSSGVVIGYSSSRKLRFREFEVISQSCAAKHSCMEIGSCSNGWFSFLPLCANHKATGWLPRLQSTCLPHREARMLSVCWGRDSGSLVLHFLPPESIFLCIKRAIRVYTSAISFMCGQASQLRDKTVLYLAPQRACFIPLIISIIIFTHAGQ